MIVSRTVARHRIATGTRPGWFGAWSLVAVDALLLFAVMVLAFGAAQGLLHSWPVWAAILALFLVFFIPLQIVLITAALWAAKSRWIGHDDGLEGGPSLSVHEDGNLPHS